MFHKFVKTRLLKEPESIYSLITWENINMNELTKKPSWAIAVLKMILKSLDS